MKIYNESKTVELLESDINPTLGYLVEEVLNISKEEQPEIKEEFHYEVVREYANGGKDVRKVIDRVGQPYKPAVNTSENILVFKKYTPDEIENIKIKNEILMLKSKLSETDYEAIKYAEGVMSFEEYSPIRIQRQEYRDKIKLLEQKLK